MANNKQALNYLKEAEEIISEHADAFSPFEALRLGLGLKYLLAYIENTAEEGQKNGTA